MKSSNLLLFVALLSACAHFPQVDAAEKSMPIATNPPALLPLSDLNALDANTSRAQLAGQSTDSRATALRAAAAALRAR